jgi:ATP-dependent Clp protease ATP-binding subunit ClpC
MQRIRFMKPHPEFSERACKAFQLAHQEAHRLNHGAVGIEHLLLGLAKEGISPAAHALQKLGFDLRYLRGHVECVRPPESNALPSPGALPYSRDLEEFLHAVIAAGYSKNMFPLTPEHLLAALINKAGAAVRPILRRRRISFWLLRWRLKRFTLW